MNKSTFEEYLDTTSEIGFVEESLESLAYVSGLPGLVPQELVLFESGELGQATYLMEDKAEIFVFGKYPIDVSTRVVRTKKQLEVPVGTEYLGELIDPFGNPLDKRKSFKRPELTRPIHNLAPGISQRQKIDTVFETGVSLVDMLIPLGKGQRELIIGDRKTGKTNFLLQTIRNQAKKGIICIYAAVGKKKHDVKLAEDYFKQTNVMGNVIIMSAFVESPASTIFISPYAAMTMAEYFKDQGKDVLLVLDDLNTHAKFYREISLLGKRFPGRNAYPADIFYTHARLLERAGNFKRSPTKNQKQPQETSDSVSITCLPVCETVQGDITGYIQTNIMSMTDGHIYFDIDLFARGRRPAINPFISVTRVGRQTQTDLRRTINRELISFLTLLEKIENFAHFGAETSSTIKNTLATGDAITSFFDQTSEIILSEDLQTFMFTLIWFGVWRGKSIDVMKADMAKIMAYYEANDSYRNEIAKSIEGAKSLNSYLTVIGQRYQELLKMAGVNMSETPSPQQVSSNQPPTPKPNQQPQPAQTTQTPTNQPNESSPSQIANQQVNQNDTEGKEE